MKALSLILVSILLSPLSSFAVADGKLVIAHRGASGYLPEHTLAAKALAHAQGADYLEQDVVMSRDGALLVLHDLWLERISDVADRFPGRAREDGHYYVIDFDLDELRTLALSEAQRPDASGEPVYPKRFPPQTSRFGVHTLAEELELIAGLNLTLGREAGIYVELKSPWFHHREGRDLARAVLQELRRYGYDSKDDPVYLQSFDYNELKRVAEELQPELGIELKLVQLVADNSWGETYTLGEGNELLPYDYDWMLSREGLARLSTLVDGIGPQFPMLVTEAGSGEGFSDLGIVARAHALGLQVHPYTFRAEASNLPAYAGSLEELLEIFLYRLDVDGVFTDFPDRAVALREHRR